MVVWLLIGSRAYPLEPSARLMHGNDHATNLIRDVASIRAHRLMSSRLQPWSSFCHHRRPSDLGRSPGTCSRQRSLSSIQLLVAFPMRHLYAVPRDKLAANNCTSATCARYSVSSAELCIF